MLLLNRINGINTQIDSYQAQITELQLRITELQAHAQEVQGCQQAADSALVQIRTALEMLASICPDEISTFKAAIDGLFDAPLNPLQLTAATDHDTAPVTGEPAAPNSPTNDQLIDVESTLITDEQPASVTTNGNGNGNGNGKANESGYSVLLTLDELKKHDRPTLIKLANKHQVAGYQNKTRDKLAELLAGKVTQEEVAEVQKGKFLKG